MTSRPVTAEELAGLRDRLKADGRKQWEIARALDVCESWLRQMIKGHKPMPRWRADQLDQVLRREGEPR